jgi:hypothetical protein
MMSADAHDALSAHGFTGTRSTTRSTVTAARAVTMSNHVVKRTCGGMPEAPGRDTRSPVADRVSLRR